MLEGISPAKLLEASKDYRFLLHRGYKQQVALRIVGERYCLTEHERHILLRAVFPRRIARERILKKIPPSKVAEYTLAVDGYNVLITVESFLLGRLLLLADDGFIRDVAGVFRKYKMSEHTRRALSLILSALKELKPKIVTFIFDQPISRSGELSALLRRCMEEYGIRGTARTSKSPDRELLESAEVIATSDTVLIDAAEKVFDLAGYVILRGMKLLKCKVNVISFKRKCGDLYVGCYKDKGSAG